MIKAEVRKSQRIKDNPESLYLSFPYSLEAVEKVKSLETRFYVPASKEWEIPVSEVNRILEMFEGQPITLKGKVSTSVTQTVIPTYQPTVPTSNFQYKTTPFPHQVEAFEYAISRPKFLLGDEQGLGKTKQSIDIAVSRKHLMKHCLIVCGVNSLKHNWVREISTHSHETSVILGTKIDSKGRLRDMSVKERLEHLNSDISEFFLITNIETLRNKEIQERLEQMTRSGVIGMVIIDEIHKCKNAQSQQGKAIHSLKSRFKLALTGTPLMNQVLDLYNPMKWLDVERGSFYAFRNRYCEMGGYGGYQVIGYKNMGELRQRFSGVMLRRRKDEVLDLPPKIRTTEYVDMTPEQSRLYREVGLAIKANLKDIEINPNPLAMLIRLRQVTAHTAILSDKVRESAKMDRLKEIVEELVESGQKAVIFSNWEEVTKLVRAEMSSYNPAYITGQTVDRQAEVDKFQTDSSCKVIIGTLGAMGTGLTLTAGTTVIFMDKAWNMANVEQAEDRCHRIGTTGTVSIVTLVCKGTIDEKIEAIIESKKFLSDELVDGNVSRQSQIDIVKEILEEIV